jgi:hypothetical protein
MSHEELLDRTAKAMRTHRVLLVLITCFGTANIAGFAVNRYGLVDLHRRVEACEQRGDAQSALRPSVP